MLSHNVIFHPGLSDLIAEGVTESVKELQNLKVNQTAEKEKQKSEAKNILLQKQRALSELFKMLAICGE